MLFAPRIKIKQLAGLCQRLATAMGAGVDARTIWTHEAERARGRVATRYALVAEAVERGESMAEALASAGEFFPALVREMVDVGEQTGHLSEVLAQLADHYQQQVVLRRTFLAAIAWPLVQLAAALAIVGFLIWVMGLIREMTHSEVDILGVGLFGNRGLLIYLGALAGVGVLLYGVVGAVRRGWLWTRAIQRAVLRLPVLGRHLQTMAMARLTWSLHLTMKAGMEVRRALRLSLRSTRNARFTDQIDRVDAEIARRSSIYDAFYRVGGFPVEFLDSVAVGEQSGRLVESMGLLAQQYRDRARTALAVLTTVAGFAVWAIIALLLIALIFRLFMFYLGMIYDAMEM